MKILNKFDFKFNYNITALDNGLKVIIIEKPNFSKVSAFFTTNYGSIDTNLVDLDTKEEKSYPEGITHFLEHIVFHIDDDSDATILFEELGAEVNAYTSKTQTTYYFNTVSNVDECLNILLDFVQTPYFSDKIPRQKHFLFSVAKRKFLFTRIITGLFVGTGVPDGPCKNGRFTQNPVNKFVLFYKFANRICCAFKDRRGSEAERGR